MINNKRFELKDSNILIDYFSERRMILDEMGITFFNIYRKYGNSQLAIDKIVQIFDISTNLAKKDYNEFLNNILFVNKCDGSILPYNNFFVLEPTSACPGNCIHCFHNNKKTYSWDETMIENIINFLIKNNIKSVSITGGEVFSVHYSKEIIYLIDKLSRNNIKIASISTNGIFINEPLLKKIKKYVDLDTVFRFSIDAIDFNKILEIRPGYTNKNLFNPIVQIDKYGYKSVYTTIISEQRKEDIIQILKFLVKLKNVQAWNIRPAVPTQNIHFSFMDDFSKVTDIYTSILQDYSLNNYNFEIRMGNVLSTFDLENPKSIILYNKGIHPCKSEENMMTLKANGEITRCPILPELSKKYIIDNVDMNSIITKNIFSNLNTKKMNCNECTFYKICGGGCRLYSIAYTDNVNGCDINSKLTINWILKDTDDLISSNWPDYYKYIKEAIANEN
jgi:radical SAM protein with 4Fe4S-binding SPASM domain